jgi:hypothetical protein
LSSTNGTAPVRRAFPPPHEWAYLSKLAKRRHRKPPTTCTPTVPSSLSHPPRHFTADTGRVFSTVMTVCVLMRSHARLDRSIQPAPQSAPKLFTIKNMALRMHVRFQPFHTDPEELPGYRAFCDHMDRLAEGASRQATAHRAHVTALTLTLTLTLTRAAYPKLHGGGDGPAR